HAGEDAVDAELATDTVRDCLGVAGDHDDLDPQSVQGIDRLARLGTHLVGELETADHLTVAQDVEDDRALLAPGLGLLALARSGLFEQAGAADADLVPVDLCAHSQSWRGADVGARRDLDSVGLCLCD